MIVDCAVYTAGIRRDGQLPVGEALAAAAEPDSFVWIGLHEPDRREFDEVAAAFGLHELAVEDAVNAHQRPKLEVYDNDLFVVLKTARYDDEYETVEFAELQLFVGESYVVTVRHGQASALSEVRKMIERDLDRIRCGPMAVLHAVIDRVVDDYGPVIDGIENDVNEIEDEVFTTVRPRRFDPSERIYKLRREVMDFRRNTEPLLDPLNRLAAGELPGAHPELHTYFRDVEDHLTRVVGNLTNDRDALAAVFEANLAQVTTRQNDDMRTISAWVAIGGIPTLVGAIYGMNFQHMPELGWRYGYLIVVVLMAAACLALYRRFKRIGWL